MKFSIWFNQKIDFLDLIDKYKDNLSSIYLPLPYSLWNSGRDESQLDNYENEFIYELIDKCKSYWIETILIMNATCEGENTWDKFYMLKLIKFVKNLHIRWLTCITLTNMLYVPFFKKALPKITIYSSINCYLKTVEQAIYFKDLWIDILTIDRDINRDIDLIKKIKTRTWLWIQMLLNEWCFSNCPYRHTHFNIAAHRVDYNTDERISNWKYNLIEDYSCVPFVNKNKKLIFRAPFIRPEDLKHYDWIVDIYKLDTRPESTQRIWKMLNAYISWFHHWDLKDIIDFPYQNVPYIDNDKLTKLDFFNKLVKCPKDCYNCNVCEQFFSS
jgi:hypothetical protein